MDAKVVVEWLRFLHDQYEGTTKQVMLEAADLIERQAAQLEALRASTASVQADQRAENDRLLAELDALRAELAALRAELAALRAERDALKADAERYRWLRDEFRSTNWYAKFFLLHGSKFDAAIDAARTGGGNG